MSLTVLVAAAVLAPVDGTATFDRLMGQARRENWARLEMGQRVARFGLGMVGTPYVGGTLDRNPTQEVCTVTFSGLDCVTFAEVAWNLARLTRETNPTAARLVAFVEQTRYRDGKNVGYVSRLHYTTDWFADTASRGLGVLVADTLPGRAVLPNRVGFMSANPHLYPALRDNIDRIVGIQEEEARINARRTWYIPLGQIAAIEGRLKDGDLIGITTNRTGLDTSHVGMVWVDERGTRRFVHASSRARRVIVDARLSEAIQAHPRSTGIVIFRPSDR